ncbi:MAG: methionyl-tRNA formyltransferase [Myxococcales bacterium]|nr:methionyl-tRNA formyltransferase [Myxococcales bacterium]MCB9519621.1 methionyl-tRNA formyltransferase [Myxococcales bacterium]
MTEGRRLRLVFMGTPDFAVPSLQALAADGRCDVALVVTQPDRPSGRGHALTAPPVKVAAVELGLPVYQPESLRDEATWEPLRAGFDLFVVAAYGQILRQGVLDLPRLGCVNVHASLLPRWRGAAPIHRAIAAGDATTGVSIMRMERGLDTGPVYAMGALMIGDEETAGELHDRLAIVGAKLLVETLDSVADTTVVPAPQPKTRTTYAKMLGAGDRRVDFEAPAAAVASVINGMSPWPGVMICCGDEPMTLLRARVSALPGDGAAAGTIVAADAGAGLHIACGDGVIEVIELKRPGKRKMAATECLRGVSLPAGAPVTSGP